MPAKKKTKKKSSVSKTTKSYTERRTEKILIENFVSLQKVMTHLSVKFDNLSSQISKLLDLFEISAKSLAEKDVHAETERRDSKKMLEGISDLRDQNKIIARGLTLMHGKFEPDSEQEHPKSPQQKPMPQTSDKSMDINQYKKSISSTPPRPPMGR